MGRVTSPPLLPPWNTSIPECFQFFSNEGPGSKWQEGFNISLMGKTLIMSLRKRQSDQEGRE